MPKFDESALVDASRQEVWDLLQDLPEMAGGLMGIERVELDPVDGPLEEGSRLLVTTSALGKVVVANITYIDELSYTIQSSIHGKGIAGEVNTRLHHINADQSKLVVNGELHGNFLTNAILGIGLAIFHREGMDQISQTLSQHAVARRERSR